MNKAKIMSAEDLNRTYLRFAHQFLEPYEDSSPLAIIGMQTRGVHIGKRIRNIITKKFGTTPDFGTLDVTFYRDDFRTKLKMPDVKVTEINFDLYERDVILVDDVLYTGRTVRSAMDALMDYGRPRSIKFCCMVDRGHRELPIAANYVGIKVPTHVQEEVRVKVKELDGEDAIYVVKNPNEE
ncbi:bifunctional pyr operon transcriptional regulator/uracil phosphoribosyltransferase PyrR [Aliifodinibius sp. S!AR15-10]|uniref:bifunctional pyr operon transcriptional regulator/uracil phosphoribosyltransferase PyrR n=1 Tax=Aliifodinibius sp. S!AR15-10 TaxID=2950437 RepID=UPI00285E5F18|nr:bifunctional pyr operon transcriptional regulator/uracil phosphoribosyltransferase PyrR [Aliifodinibius sp. S!AR15-10]MDR8392028.1 bifunctional pyr operon transcriptional regulator/uracil phosphoribosyltransferase PyrR [Aliifodinibius sp. S!AR15-10]